MTITRADEQTVRRFYEAIVARDLAAAEACFAPDAVWYLPGKSAMSGEHRGWSAIRDGVILKLGPLSGGTLKVELLDIAVGQEFAIAVQHTTASHQGRVLDVTGCQVLRLKDGLITEIRGHYSDLYALDAFFGTP
jgi:uncharacterized protein